MITPLGRLDGPASTNRAAALSIPRQRTSNSAQQPTPIGQADPVLLEGHDVVVGHQPQHPPERVLVGTDGDGPLWYR